MTLWLWQCRTGAKISQDGRFNTGGGVLTGRGILLTEVRSSGKEAERVWARAAADGRCTVGIDGRGMAQIQVVRTLSLRCLYGRVLSIEYRSFSEGNRKNREIVGKIFCVAISGLLKLHEKSPLEVVETFQRAFLVSADGGNRTPETVASKSFFLVFSRSCSFIR